MIKTYADVTLDTEKYHVIDQQHGDDVRMEIISLGVMDHARTSDGAAMLAIKQHSSNALLTAVMIPVELVDDFCAMVTKQARGTYEEDLAVHFEERQQISFYACSSAYNQKTKEHFLVAVGVNKEWVPFDFGKPFTTREEALAHLNTETPVGLDWIVLPNTEAIVRTTRRTVITELREEIP